MKILRIFNNNIVATQDDEGNDLIIQGAGVGFNKSVGNVIDPDTIEKIFTLKDSNSSKYQQFFEQVPIEYFEISEMITKKTQEVLGGSQNMQSLIALADHIYQAVGREKSGGALPNLMLDEIKMIYRDEFEVATWAIQMIEEKLNVKLSEDEAGYIALHVVNANTSLDAGINSKVLRFTRGLMDLIRTSLNVELKSDDYNTSRLLTHLKFLAIRIFNEETQVIDVMDEMYEILINRDPRLRTCLEQIEIFTKQEFGYSLQRNEETYLMVHLSKIL